jgi:hypothetical protein
MHQALAISLSRAVSALDEGSLTADALPSGPRAGLASRRQQLREALAPCGPQRAAANLATLANMSFRGEPSQAMLTAIGKQDVADLADLPEWALAAACKAYRLAEIGDGHWRPKAGELRTEALRRAETHMRELAQIERVLAAPLALGRRPPATPEQRAEMSRRLRDLGARLAMSEGA